MNTTHYLCGVDYQHEQDQGDADYFDSVELLKKSKPCWEDCGIVKITLDEMGNEVDHLWIAKQDL